MAEPDWARPLPEALAALSKLAGRDDFRVAIVSGRRLDDLRRLCPVAGCWYVGGHGNETGESDRLDEPDAAGAKFDFAAARREMAALTIEVRRQMPAWPGARIETKPYSVAVHFREAPQWAEAIRKAFSAMAARGGGERFRVMLGRQVAELLPAAALTKGHAVQRLRSQLRCDLAFYFGDDLSDEDVFRLRNKDIIGVKVQHGEGPTETAADFRVHSPAEVVRALKRIAAVRRESQTGNPKDKAILSTVFRRRLG